jgi:hypothetical protein
MPMQRTSGRRARRAAINSAACRSALGSSAEKKTVCARVETLPDVAAFDGLDPFGACSGDGLLNVDVIHACTERYERSTAADDLTAGNGGRQGWATQAAPRDPADGWLDFAGPPP